MTIYKCKICGGTLEIDTAQSVATCEYCGTKQTLPKLDDDRKANLYDRANHFRRNNDFDKAMAIYESILNEDNSDAEAYWSLVLCRYGIEYVEDPSTHKRVPTVNRAQFTSIFDDEDYKSALQYADSFQREIYEAEAAAINEIQKGILAISQKEEPFDVFVCYKETDNNGRRTQDSVLATELYHELTREGFKVFFSRITLEDKLGVAYEPYIFAALHSAKVMVVLGTRPEHFNAVWVKNEWSRYLALIKNGAKKTLIPAYRDMDPYDLPEEFSHLQAQDMSKLGFMQDLTRGIKKIVEASAPKTTVKETFISNTTVTNATPLLKRAFMFLEDGDFERADDFLEQVLNQDPENAQAYLGKLMVELRVLRQSDLANCANSFESSRNYQKAMRFADATLAADLKRYIATIKERNAKKAEEARKESLYLGAMDEYKTNNIPRLQNAIKVFTSLSGYKDSDECVRLCETKITQLRIQEENARIEAERLAEEKRIAAEQARLEKQHRDEERKVAAEKRAKTTKKIVKRTAIIIGIVILSFVLLIVGGIVYLDVTDKPIDKDFEQKESQQIHELVYYVPANWLYDAEGSSENTKYYVRYNNWDEFVALMCIDYIGETDIITVDEAVSDYTEDYADASVTNQIIGEQTFSVVSYVRESDNYCSLVYITEKDFSTFQVYFRFTSENSGKEIFEEIVAAVEFDKYVNPKEDTYNEALGLMSAEKYDEAISAFTELGGYKDSAAKITECENAIIEAKYNDASHLLADGKYEEALVIFEKLHDYKDSDALIQECNAAILENKYNAAVILMSNGELEAAISAFESIIDYKDSNSKISECKNQINENKYNEAVSLATNGSYAEAIELFNSLGDYKDSADLSQKYTLLICDVGDTITFGTYEQDNNADNGTEAIEWIVLERDGNKVLVVTEYCIEWLPFHNTFTKVGWKDSSIRSWLNNTFLNEAFTAQEKSSIISTQHTNPDFYDDSESERNWRGTTTDRVFLLSSGEADRYFSSDSERRAEGTEYACNKGKSASWYWWLRSANNIEYAGFVSEGELGYGEEVDRNMGIRPAMWIDISSME